MKKYLLVAAAVTAGMGLTTPTWADPFLFSTGTPDGLLGAFSQPAITGHLETETADDFILTVTTSITQATITGLIQKGTPLANISNVEVEIYHIFPTDSAAPPSGNVPARANSPADVEIGSATRDGSAGTLNFTASLLDNSFSVLNSVADGIHPAPENMTNGEGPANGEMVQITITFTPPIVLPADHYFFRPEVQVPGGFLYLSAPKPIVTPGTPFTGDLQAWIRNSDLKPDWLRIGTDIIGGTPVVTFNMTFSLTGETVSGAPTPTATSQPPTATPTDLPGNDGGGDCSIGASPSANRHTPWPLLVPVAVLWWTRRRRHRLGVSNWGVFDMVGNIEEWVADWGPQSTACPGWGTFSDDVMCLSGASTTATGPGALARGGSFTDFTEAGVFALDAGPVRSVVGNSPGSSRRGLGFRCAR